MGEVYRRKLYWARMICLISTVSTSQVGWQAVINHVDERLWNQSRQILILIFLSFCSKEMTYLSIKTTYSSQQETDCRPHIQYFGLFLCFSLVFLSLSLSLLFPWKLASRWRGWRGSGRQTRTSGPVWPCMVRGPVGELGNLHCELTKLIRLQTELFLFFVFCILNTSQT